MTAYDQSMTDHRPCGPLVSTMVAVGELQEWQKAQNGQLKRIEGKLDDALERTNYLESEHDERVGARKLLQIGVIAVSCGGISSIAIFIYRILVG